MELKSSGTIEIRQAIHADMPSLSSIYKEARDYMSQEGNGGQWGSSHPLPSLLEKDIDGGSLYVLTLGGIPHAAFSLIADDPCYLDPLCQWHFKGSYLAIHSLASDGVIHHVFKFVLAFAFSKTSIVRIDTHKDNKTMLNLIHVNGFIDAGECHQPDGTMRLCFEKTE